MVIAYDVADDDRRNRIARVLAGFGHRVQESVFEADLDRRRLDRLLCELRPLVDTKADSVRVYRVCESCVKEAVRLGEPPFQREPGYYIV